MQTIVNGLPTPSNESYPELTRTLESHYAAIKSGRLPYRRRIYALILEVGKLSRRIDRIAGNGWRVPLGITPAQYAPGGMNA